MIQDYKYTVKLIEMPCRFCVFHQNDRLCRLTYLNYLLFLGGFQVFHFEQVEGAAIRCSPVAKINVGTEIEQIAVSSVRPQKSSKEIYVLFTLTCTFDTFNPFSIRYFKTLTQVLFICVTSTITKVIF